MTGKQLVALSAVILITFYVLGKLLLPDISNLPPMIYNPETKMYEMQKGK